MNDGAGQFKLALNDIREVSLAVTLYCPVGCRFCNKRASPSRHESMTKQQIWDAIDQSVELFPNLELISISGGEPLTRPDLVQIAVDHATEHKIPSAVATSACWATSYRVAIKMLQDLKDRGLTTIAISMDDEKQRIVPVDYVAYAARAAQNLLLSVALQCHTNSNMTSINTWNYVLVQALKRTAALRVDYPKPQNGGRHPYIRREWWQPQVIGSLTTDAGPIVPFFKNDFTYGQERIRFDVLEGLEYSGMFLIRPYCLSIVTFNPNDDVWWCFFKLGNLREEDENLKEMIQRAANSWAYPLLKESPFTLARAVDKKVGSNLRDLYLKHACKSTLTTLIMLVAFY